jgi:hypothetical protein
MKYEQLRWVVETLRNAAEKDRHGLGPLEPKVAIVANSRELFV